MHAYLNNSTNWEGYLYGKITRFFNPEEGDFLTIRVICTYTLVTRSLACDSIETSF